MADRSRPSRDPCSWRASDSPTPPSEPLTWTASAAATPSCCDRVEATAQANDQPPSFLERPPAAADWPTVDGPTRRPDGPLGTVIVGPYKLLEQIGEGGMGIVYMAEQTEPVRRAVALKVIKPGMDSKAGARPVRGRAAGAGADGPPEHRQGARRRDHRQRPAVLRHGTGQGHADHRVLRRAAADARGSGWNCSSRSARRSSTPTRRASSTATSSRRTCWSHCTTTGRCPR